MGVDTCKCTCVVKVITHTVVYRAECTQRGENSYRHEMRWHGDNSHCIGPPQQRSEGVQET